ncbi:MAG: hypothetical protein IKT04_01215, partial [Clostridia bacterium]|nr:hypothetical protein [Clostridia bacterium]
QYKEYFKRSKKLYCYEMSLDKQKALIVCSFSDRNLHFKAPKGFKLQEKNLVLWNYPDKPNGDKDELFLRPYEAAVYLYK